MDKCEWCGMIHETICPQIKAIEYHSDGTTKRIEFFGPKDYPMLTSLVPPQSKPNNHKTR